jgi:hypothetical protein
MGILMAQMKKIARLTPNFGWCKLESTVWWAA